MVLVLCEGVGAVKGVQMRAAVRRDELGATVAVAGGNSARTN